MKILAIDCGNTRIKWGLWDGAAWLRVGAMTHDELGDARSGIAPAFASLPPPAHIAIANVAGEGVRATVERALASINAPIMWARSTERQCGVINRYGAPATLGVDRWAALIGARHVQPGACIVVGAGTATTIDLLSASGEFRGGVILPGLELMKRSLAEHTARLPLADGAYADEPRSTEDAIESGALHAQAGAIERMHALASGLQGGSSASAAQGAACMMCGGAAARIAERLRIAHRRVEHLVLDGLVRIALEQAT